MLSSLHDLALITVLVLNHAIAICIIIPVYLSTCIYYTDHSGLSGKYSWTSFFSDFTSSSAKKSDLYVFAGRTRIVIL